MLQFCPAKINLGLFITEKRTDGYHNIETVFYPIDWFDVLEVIENTESQGFELKTSGLAISGKTQENLLYKAWELISAEHKIPPVKVYLHKRIPMGAGLGGGSSNAANFINLVDEKFNLNIPFEKKLKIASGLGSDCAFFINPSPKLAKEKGDFFEPVNFSLKNHYILLVYPNIHSNTAEAYKLIKPEIPNVRLKSVMESEPIENWKNFVKNDFEPPLFSKFPVLKDIKNKLYEEGAVYASLSGSGSALYGIFKQEPKNVFSSDYKTTIVQANY